MIEGNVGTEPEVVAPREREIDPRKLRARVYTQGAYTTVISVRAGKDTFAAHLELDYEGVKALIHKLQEAAYSMERQRPYGVHIEE